MTKDIIWAFANAVSQVCVEDDSVSLQVNYSASPADGQSCERVREKLELFEPQGDMVAFVRGWGTGDQIPGKLAGPSSLARHKLTSRPTKIHQLLCWRIPTPSLLPHRQLPARDQQDPSGGTVAVCSGRAIRAYTERGGEAPE